MWITSTIGFFSVVQKPGDTDLTVRARARADLDRLRERYLPSLSPTLEGGGTDYPFRARVGHAAMSDAMHQMVADIGYANFKSAVAATAGPQRSKVYGRVWSELLALESLAEEAPSTGDPKRAPSGRKAAYGGVVLDGEGRVLLREPANHYGGYVWTFPKGRPDAGEAPETAALREVLEETGVVAEILEPIEGWFEGDTTDTRFFLMRLARDTEAFDAETASVRWASLDEARALIAQTRSTRGRARDLAVLDRLRELVASAGHLDSK